MKRFSSWWHSLEIRIFDEKLLFILFSRFQSYQNILDVYIKLKKIFKWTFDRFESVEMNIHQCLYIFLTCLFFTPTSHIAHHYSSILLCPMPKNLFFNLVMTSIMMTMTLKVNIEELNWKKLYLKSHSVTQRHWCCLLLVKPYCGMKGDKMGFKKGVENSRIMTTQLFLHVYLSFFHLPFLLPFVVCAINAE